MYKVLTIAGSDNSGGAGIQADLKTFSAHEVYGMSVITAITAQNTNVISRVRELDEEIIREQIKTIFDDIMVDGIKIGMVYSKKVIQAIRTTLIDYNLPPIVLDPVMIATSGRKLLNEDAISELVELIFPMCHIVTPNIMEAEYLTGLNIQNVTQMEGACKNLFQLGMKYVLIKGGHLSSTACDVLYDGKSYTYYEHELIDNPNTHGTGCTLSSAIAANLSKGFSVEKSIALAKQYISNAIKHGFSIGKGPGPVHHFYNYWKRVE